MSQAAQEQLDKPLVQTAWKPLPCGFAMNVILWFITVTSEWFLVALTCKCSITPRRESRRRIGTHILNVIIKDSTLFVNSSKHLKTSNIPPPSRWDPLMKLVLGQWYAPGVVHLTLWPSCTILFVFTEYVVVLCNIHIYNCRWVNDVRPNFVVR